MYLSWVGSVPLSFKQRAVDKARNLIHHKYAKHASLKDASSLKSEFWLVMNGEQVTGFEFWLRTLHLTSALHTNYISNTLNYLHLEVLMPNSLNLFLQLFSKCLKHPRLQILQLFLECILEGCFSVGNIFHASFRLLHFRMQVVASIW